MKTVFGPVPSRRLGQSLGVDTIPSKTCNWNCVYCQLGRTQPMVNVRAEYFPREEILAEIRQSLEAHAPGQIDWITFVGSGEPTLHAGIGWLIAEIKKSPKFRLRSSPTAVCSIAPKSAPNCSPPMPFCPLWTRAMPRPTKKSTARWANSVLSVLWMD